MTARAAPEGLGGLRPLLDPRSVVVVGASTDPRKVSGRPLRYLLHHGYRGRIYAVNAASSEVQGMPAYPDVLALPETVELAVVCLPAPRVCEALEACGRRGIPAAVVLSSGFAETGPAGEALQQELGAVARRHGMLLCGPNSVGVINVWSRLTASFSAHLERDLLPGGIAFVSQSGAMGTATFSRMQDEGLGFSYFVSSANEAALDALDFIDAFLLDQHTQVIAAYIEGLRDGRKLFPVADRARALGKPIVVLKAGQTDPGRRAALTHTAAVTGAHAVYQTAFRQAGIITVTDVEELVDACRLLSRRLALPGRRIALITGSGGAAVLAADHFAKVGLEIPLFSPSTVARLRGALPPFAACQNPADVTGEFFARPGLLQSALSVVTQDAAVDAIALLLPMAPPDVARRVATDIVAFGERTTVPVAVGWLGGSMVDEGRTIIRNAGIPLYTSLQALASGLGILVQAGRARAPAQARRPPPELPAAFRRMLEDAGHLGFGQARALLTHYGIPAPREAIVADPEDAVAQAVAIGFPVVLKLLSPSLSHKSDVGAVRMGLGTPQSVREAAQDLLDFAKRALAPEQLEGVLVQESIADATEVLIGAARDPQFGPVLTFGVGGTLVEVLRDVAQRIPPLSRQEAESMLAEIRTAQILDGVRGGPRRDREALVTALLGLSTLIEAAGDLIEGLDINPLMVLEEGRGVVAVDVRLVGRKAP